MTTKSQTNEGPGGEGARQDQLPRRSGGHAAEGFQYHQIRSDGGNRHPPGRDPKQADQIVRGAIVLPHGIGKSLRVVVFAKGDKVDEARAPAPMKWAVPIGRKDQGRLDRLRRLHCVAGHDGDCRTSGKVLGPKGLMPSPRAGTVTPELAKRSANTRRAKWSFATTRAESFTPLWERSVSTRRNLSTTCGLSWATFRPLSPPLYEANILEHCVEGYHESGGPHRP